MLILFNGTSCKESEIPIGINHSIWVESKYLRGFQPTTGAPLLFDNVVNLSETLTKNAIKYAYFFAGPYDEYGHLPEYPFSKLAKSVVDSLKILVPDVEILPWLGGVQGKTVQLEDSLWVFNALHDTKTLLNYLDLKGVHIDFEYILDSSRYLMNTFNREKRGDPHTYGRNVIEFHKRLREMLPSKFISSTVLATSQGTKPWKRKTPVSELSELLNYIDQISFLYYDTGIKVQSDFQLNCDQLVNDMSILDSQFPNVQLLISIGTFKNVYELQKYRDLRIESVSNSLQTIKGSLRKIESPILDGIALYCDWETDETEWREFRKNK